MCPSYMVTREEKHSTRGRMRLLFEMTRGETITDGWRSKEVADALDLCLACKGCKSDCPVSVDVATYKSEFLSHHYAGRFRPRSPLFARLAAAVGTAGRTRRRGGQRRDPHAGRARLAQGHRRRRPATRRAAVRQAPFTRWFRRNHKPVASGAAAARWCCGRTRSPTICRRISRAARHACWRRPVSGSRSRRAPSAAA